MSAAPRKPSLRVEDPSGDTWFASEVTGLSPATLETLRSRGGGPAFAKLGRRVSYRLSDLRAWLEARTVRSTSEYSALPSMAAK